MHSYHIMGMPGEGWSTAEDLAACGLLARWGFHSCSPPISLLPSIICRGPHLGLHVSPTGWGMARAMAALRYLLRHRSLPSSIGLIVTGPLDVPLPMIKRDGTHSPLFLSPLSHNHLGPYPIFRDELRLSWIMTEETQERFRLERHLWAGETPPKIASLPGPDLELAGCINISLGARISSLKQDKSLQPCSQTHTFFRDTLSILWPNAQVTAYRDKIVHKQLIISAQASSKFLAGQAHLRHV